MEKSADLYRIIVVDDEQIIRDGLQQHVDWEGQGYQLVATCEDGAQALALLEQEPVDVIISDISMPFLDGLELSELVRSRFPQTRIILLTGHDRIEYAQEAVKQQVARFLLKPITPSEIRDVLASTRNDLDQERRELRNRALLERQLAESMPLLRERVLNRILGGQLSRSEIDSALELSGLCMPGRVMAVVLADSDEPPDRERSSTDVELDLLAVQNLVRHVEGDPDARLVFRDTEGRVVCIIGADSPREASQEALHFAERMAARVETMQRTSVTIGIGRAVSGVGGIVQSYREAVFALRYRFMVGSGRIIEYNDASGGIQPNEDGSESPSVWHPTRFEHDIVMSLGSGRVEDSIERIRVMIQDLRERELHPDQCRLTLMRLVGRVVDTALDLSIEPGLVFGDSSPLDALAGLKTLQQIEEWLVGVFERWHAVLGNRRQERSLRKAAEAQEYIRQHFADPDITVERVCSAIGVGSSYFSSILKQHVGKTFIEYLTSLRIERAKELLRASDQLTYEIASAVGYRDPHYFSNSFKRYSGVTPREYRAQHD